MQAVFVIAIVLGLFLVFIDSLWPFLLTGLFLWIIIRGSQYLQAEYTFEGRRWRRMRRDHEEEFFHTDEELRHHADDAYQDYLDGKDDGGFPPFKS